jgi:hypothetical protein
LCLLQIRSKLSVVADLEREAPHSAVEIGMACRRSTLLAVYGSTIWLHAPEGKPFARGVLAASQTGYAVSAVWSALPLG